MDKPLDLFGGGGQSAQVVCRASDQRSLVGLGRRAEIPGFQAAQDKAIDIVANPALAPDGGERRQPWFLQRPRRRLFLIGCCWLGRKGSALTNPKLEIGYDLLRKWIARWHLELLVRLSDRAN